MAQAVIEDDIQIKNVFKRFGKVSLPSHTH